MDSKVYFCCTRCGNNVKKPTYLCENRHLACDHCRKLFCQICRYPFDNRKEELERGELNVSFSTRPTTRRFLWDPFEPIDGNIKFGEPFPLPRSGSYRFNAVIDHQRVVFNWKINPHDGTIEVNVTPKTQSKFNWFVVEFALPSNRRKKIKKEWAVNYTLHINYGEVELLYEEDIVMCVIHLKEVPYAVVVEPFENRLKNVVSSFLKPRKRET